MKKVVCFGEILLRMSPSPGPSWLQSNNMPVYIGGAELNVAAALAKWQVPVNYFTAVPDNYLSAAMLGYVSSRGIDTGAVMKTGERVGIYYLQQGTDLKHSAVIYDRAGSSFSSLKPGMIDWDRILAGVSLFHFSAISPALGEDTAAVCREAVNEASRRNIGISVDLNYRASLWNNGRDPVAVMTGLMDKCNLVMGNIWSANTLLGIPLDQSVISSSSAAGYREHARQTALAIQKSYPACVSVANTFRFDNEGNGITYFATIDDASGQHHSPVYRSAAIKDKVGSGDCFMAGLIYGNYTGLSTSQTIDLAARAAFLKMHEVGDTTNNDITFIQSAAIKHE